MTGATRAAPTSRARCSRPRARRQPGGPHRRPLHCRAVEGGGKILRRQDLPKEAFLDLETVKRLPDGNGGCLRVIAVSHPWQQPDHPDPKEVNLTLLAKVLSGLSPARRTEATATPTPVSSTS